MSDIKPDTNTTAPVVPSWVKDAIFYQIFPDRFAASARVHKPGPLEPWDSAPTVHGFKGGDLLGVVEHLDHLQALGVNAIYLNPIFQSASNHRYHTFDYFQIDPLLGGNDAFRELLDAAHERDIKVVIDGVFNHASRGFWAFHHIMEAGAASPYLDWFRVRGFPVNAYDESSPPNYDAWWNLHALPKFNISNPDVREYLLDVAEYWIRFGADGWRLDVPAEIEDTRFWREFRRRVRYANPEAYTVGEIWHLAPDWLEGDRFDALMNYHVSFTALGFFGARSLRSEFRPGGFALLPFDGAQALERLNEAMTAYHPRVSQAQLNLLGSHDTPRFATMAGDDYTALHLATLLQMTLPGAPCIYYGDEIGMLGGADPECRAGFVWDSERWQRDTWDHTQRAIALRRQQRVLRDGEFIPIYGKGEQLAYALRSDDETALVAFNAGNESATIVISLPADLPASPTPPVDLWQGSGRPLSSPQWVYGPSPALALALPPRSARVLKLR